MSKVEQLLLLLRIFKKRFPSDDFVFKSHGRGMSFHLMPASFTLTIPNSYWALVWCATLPTVKCLI